MAYRNEGPWAEVAGEALEKDRLIKLSSGTAVYCDAGENPDGITADKVASGANVTIYPIKGNIERVTASKAIAINTEIYVANDGKVSDAAVGESIGITKQAATAAGAIIPAIIWGTKGRNSLATIGSGIIHLFEDFLSGCTEDGQKFSETADKGDWLKTSVDGSSGGADVCKVSDDGPGGILQLTCNAANADLENLQMNGEQFQIASGKPLWFHASVALKDVDKCDFFIGLADSTTAALADDDRIGFQVDHDGNIDCIAEQNGTQTSQDSGVDFADCAAVANFATTKKKLSFHWDGVDTLRFYVDDVLKKTITDNGSTIVFPDDEVLSPVIEIVTHTGAAVVQTAFVDFIEVIAER
jgi:hypothetical protein